MHCSGYQKKKVSEIIERIANASKHNQSPSQPVWATLRAAVLVHKPEHSISPPPPHSLLIVS